MDIEKTMDIVRKGTVEIIGEEELKEKMLSGRVLKIKLGLDPSAPDIHLGHTVVLRKLKAFQDLGHEVHIIIGDFTGMIGDPTGKSASRVQLTREQVIENAKTYTSQIFEILDEEKTMVHFNSSWLRKLTLQNILELTKTTTVARMLEREDFRKRYESHTPIGIHEFLYPLMQAYDSLAIEADVELGGTDQTFNLLMGRTVQKAEDVSPQTVILLPLLEGLDGVQKMSKSLGNYVGIHEDPDTMFSKVMTLPDDLILRYFTLVTDRLPEEILALEKRLETENPRDIKMLLAEEITAMYHDTEKAEAAREKFIRVFTKEEIPEDVKEISISEDGFSLGHVLKEEGLVASFNEYRRLLSQNGISINGDKISSEESLPASGSLLVKVGKRKFIRIHREAQ
ncbi:tyrosine--tRNA ligase [Proteiniclasticum sp. SCR006]|uniref:Tyrosine--tRNA ligase n=1 Tax=Proteiniclasticum aestuarii TaxID=2817862 RepID=A0A939H628_9CLOT|nr:tyrosine--tRNA ligase [Proteiniclasticum aestuarii]MBO1264917.1 tyrosine--tRNA ligase [Proteiniclasticum aestuarii]